MNREFVTVSEVKEYIFPVSKKIIRRIVNNNNEIRVVRNGNRILINRNDLLSYLNSQNKADTTPVFSNNHLVRNNEITNHCRRTDGYGIDWNRV